MSASLGKRHTCVNCDCKYYDLHRREPECPRCGASPDAVGPSGGAVISLEEFRSGRLNAPGVLPEAPAAAADAFNEVLNAATAELAGQA